MGFRIEIDGIVDRNLADHLVAHLDPAKIVEAGMSIRVLDVLDEHTPEGSE